VHPTLNDDREEDCVTRDLIGYGMCMISLSSDDMEFFSAEE
jgi:hypothetical protein